MGTIDGELIGSDRPKKKPSLDAYDFMPFAAKVAETIGHIRAPHGLVLAINGAWGSGKSTLLNFVVAEMQQRNATKGESITIIEFNPWWFQTHEDLASQFLACFQSALLRKSERLRHIAGCIGEYAEAIGSSVALISSPFGAAVSKILSLFKKKDSVTHIKSTVAKKLEGSGERFVFVVDDIDRLAPADVVSLFRVIKALADFPNVIYVLAYDHDVVARSIGQYLGVDGCAYLEKLVQATFAIPAVNKVALRKKLFRDLDSILAAYQGASFDNSYWARVYFDGVDSLIAKPRDTVRLINSLAVTYPSVAGEVNPVDFIAMETIRVFAPAVYWLVRARGDEFTGPSSSDHSDQEALAKFHKEWIVDTNCPAAIRHILREIFPKFAKASRASFYHVELGSANWRRDLRVCSPDIFPVYFEFGVNNGVSRKSLDELLQAASAGVDIACEVLLSAKVEKTVDGSSRSSALLDRLSDLGSTLPISAAEGLLKALFKVGDRVLPSEDEDVKGLMSVPNRWRLRWTVLTLFAALIEADRVPQLIALVNSADALSLCVDIVDTIDAGLKDPAEQDEALRVFSEPSCDNLKCLVCSRLFHLTDASLLELSGLDFVIHRWITWGGLAHVRRRIVPLLMEPAAMLRLLEGFLRYSRMQSGDDPLVRKIPNLDPSLLHEIVSADWLDVTVGMAASSPLLTENQKLAISAYFSHRSSS